jgi:lipoprotein-anchoring transpeptidase ErfK/SrfK
MFPDEGEERMRRGLVLIAAGLVAGVGLTPAPAAAAAGPCGTTGPGQLAVERYLAAHAGTYGKVTVDGRQSVADCKAIARFQARFGISPAAGLAGPTTGAVAQRLTKAQVNRCRTGTRVCVDLTTQTFWMVRGGKIVLGPTTVRTGRAGGYRTPTGTFRVGAKKRMTTSSYYGTKMPYWQHFYRDMGFHETPSYLYQGPGSHGCVNLLRRDAISLYKLTSRGTPVMIFGRKPGT